MRKWEWGWGGNGGNHMRWNWYVMYSSQNLLPGRGGNSANWKWRDYIIIVGTSMSFPAKMIGVWPKSQMWRRPWQKKGPSTAILATNIIVSNLFSALTQMNGVMFTMVLLAETRAMMRTSVIRIGPAWPHLVHHQRSKVWQVERAGLDRSRLPGKTWWFTFGPRICEPESRQGQSSRPTLNVVILKRSL